MRIRDFERAVMAHYHEIPEISEAHTYLQMRAELHRMRADRLVDSDEAYALETAVFMHVTNYEARANLPLTCMPPCTADLLPATIELQREEEPRENIDHHRDKH